MGLYAELSKARLSSLVVITAGAGYAAAGGEMDYTTMAALCGGTSLAAGSAGTFNQVRNGPLEPAAAVESPAAPRRDPLVEM